MSTDTTLTLNHYSTQVPIEQKSDVPKGPLRIPLLFTATAVEGILILRTDFSELLLASPQSMKEHSGVSCGMEARVGGGATVAWKEHLTYSLLLLILGHCLD